jgi:acyl carrier protein
MNSDLERVQQVVAEVLDVDPSRVTLEARFVEDLGASSLQSVELVAAFEEEFDIEMDEQQALGVKDVDTAVAFIRRHADTQHDD